MQIVVDFENGEPVLVIPGRNILNLLLIWGSSWNYRIAHGFEEKMIKTKWPVRTFGPPKG